MNTQPTTTSIKGLSVKAVLASLACVVLAGCVSESATNTWGTRLFTVSPGKFSCPGTPALLLKIEQDVNTKDASKIWCDVGGSLVDCTNLTFDPNFSGPTVSRSQLVKWTLLDTTATDPFYVIFDADKSPAQRGKNRGANIVASENGELCMRVNRRARERDRPGEPYRYSVYVKHCAAGDVSCKPKVLDPIIYVKKVQ